ncbi:MAG: hypothetical protein JWR12_2019 [Mucilaginibacter sp.]|nr:hypothetical protein [Mucilaginibacter sp.]
MPVKYFFSKKGLLLLVLLISCSLTFAQNYQKISARIDSLAKKDLPKSALLEVDQLEQLARKERNAPMQIKAILYRIQFQSAIDENAMVAAINRVKSDVNQASFPVKPVLQSLLATLYQQYYEENRWLFSQRTRLASTDSDFTKWDLQTINNEISRQFNLSLKDYKLEQNTSVTVLNGVLEGDTTTRYLRPTLYDLLVHRALDFYLAEEPALTKPKQPFALSDPRFFDDRRAFAGLKIATTDTTSTFYQGIKYLQQAMLFHLQKPNEASLADIDLRRLGFLYGHANVPAKDSLYLKALEEIETRFSSSAINADALVLHGKYYQDRDSLKTALSYYIKADKAWPGSLGARNANGYIKQIQQKELSANLEDVGVSGKPLLALLNYRNIKTARITIYKIWSTQYDELASIRQDKNQFNNGVIQASYGVLNYLKRLKPVKVEDLQLPNPGDYRSHSAEFKVDPLQPGVYVLMVEDTLTNDPTTLQLTSFKVSHLSFVTKRNSDGKIQLLVADRETGVPISGIKVTIDEDEPLVTDKNGICYTGLYNSNNYSVDLTTAHDTLYTEHRYTSRAATDDIVNRTILFTDRQIYRPGQAVYFKGLQIRTVKGRNNLETNKRITVEIADNNGKNIASIPFVTNEFGTFSGTFIIPQNILNGNVNISTDDGDKQISVEEYKRPSFSVGFNPVKNSYKPNDSVTLKGTVSAYSGYGISNARVAFHITRERQFVYRPHSYINYPTGSTEIATDTITTDNQGRFEIKFKAVADKETEQGERDYAFKINADVTDGSGETRSANLALTVADKNLVVTANIPNKIIAKDSVRIAAEIYNRNNVMQSGAIQLKVYALKEPGHLFKDRLWGKPDQYLLSKDQYKTDFPYYSYRNEEDKATWTVENKVADLKITTDGNRPSIFNLDILKNHPTGSYKISISAQDERGDTTSSTWYVYVVNAPAKPASITDWAIPLNTTASGGKPAEFLLGTGETSHVLMEKYSGQQLLSSQWLTISSKQQLINIAVGAKENDVSVQFLMVYQNRIYTSREVIKNSNDNDDLDIRFLTFRNKLQPGDKEQWKLQISGRNKERQAAEMVADLYDASLDALARPDNWKNVFNDGYRYSPQYFNWDYGFVRAVITQPLQYKNYYFNQAERNYEHLIFFSGGINRLNGRAAGVMVRGISMASATVESPALNEVAVGYGTQRKMDINGAEIPKELNVSPGDKFKIGNDQLIASPVITRKNFNETAFFYPQLHTDEKGGILIDFTIPEALTKWRFKGFAHTKDLKTGYIECEIVTQKELSITANAPRFLREGDTIIISARLANLTASTLKGKVQLQLFNAINMQPVNLLANAADAQQKFDVASASNKAISFKLVIPAGLDAITYRLTAESGKYSDGEENTLPVLPNSMLVTESMPMMVRAGQTRDFTFNKLVNQTSSTLKSKTLTLEYTQNPAWYAVQALPYMMEFQYECSEQIFNCYYANSMATSLVNRMPVIKQVFDQWKNSNSPELLSNLEKNQELKATLIEETPWLQDAVNESEQKKRIALLFDLNKMSYELQANLDKLQKKQLPDGGFPWFGGDRADRYITQNILSGIGQLYHLNIADLKNQALKDVADKAMAYLDQALMDDAAYEKSHKTYENRELSPLEIHSYYTQSYFTSRTIIPAMQALLDNYLSLAQKQWVNGGVYEKAMIALTMQRNKKPEVATAIIKSLLETAQQSDDLGMYWAKNQPGSYWYQSPIETQSLMIELFTEAGDNYKAIEEMKIWLLRGKQTANWKTTKATAAACYALLIKGDNWLADQAAPDISLGGKNLSELRPDIKADAGTGYIKTNWVNEQVKPELGKVELKNNGKTMSWGALHWQYLERLDKITPSTADIHLERKYFIIKQTDAGQSLITVDAAHQPKTGDLLKVVVYLNAGRDFEYVQLKDMRPAGMEPVDVLSSYKYQDGLYYYQVTKDVATNFFISNLNKGNYVFEYRLRIAQPGNFSTGISTVQSMYAPEFNAHSEVIRMTVKP